MNSIFFTSSTSVGQIYGNVIKAVEMYLMNNLPKDYLKDRTISTRSSFRYFRKFINTRKEFEKKQRPFMIIRPNLEPYDAITGNEFLSGTSIVWYSGTLTGSSMAIQNFFRDPKAGLGMGFKINRFKMTFDVAIQCNTYFSALDLYNYLGNTLTFGRPLYIPTSLESMIPKEMLIHLCEIVGINIDEVENIPVLTRYLRTHSSYPISYKMRNATSNDEYFLFYPQNIIATFTDLTCEEANRKNMVEEFTNVTFKIECEFNAIASYLLWGKKKTNKKIKLCIHDSDASTSTPIYTYERIFSDNDFISQGYSLYSANIIKTDPDKDGEDDYLDIRECIPPDLKRVTDDILASGNDMSLLLKPRVIFNNLEASADTDFDINWSKYQLTIKHSDKTYTYRFILYINLNYYNEYVLAHDIDSTDQQTLDGSTTSGYKD